MPDTKISDLTSGNPPQDADEFPVRRSAGNNKLSWADMRAAFGADLGGGWSLDGATGVMTATGRTELLLENSGAGQQTLWKTVSQLYPGEVGYSMQFSEGTFSTPFTYVDRVMNFGYNYSGTSPMDATKPAMFFQFESAYQLNNDPSPTQKVTEWHLNHIAVGGTIKRPFNYVGAWDGGFIQVGMSGSEVNISDLAAISRIYGRYTNAETTLAAGINSSTTAITLANARAVANGQTLTIQAEGANTTESVTVVSGGGTVNLTVTRARSGTTASAHGAGAIVLLPDASLRLNSSLTLNSDADSPVVIANAAGTRNLFALNWGSSTLTSSFSVSAAAQNLLIVTNTNAGGTAALQVKADNGAKTATWNIDASGSMTISANGTGGGMYFDYPVGGAVWRTNGYATAMSLSNDGYLGVGLGPFSASAWLHIKAGTSAAAPLKLNSGTNLTTPQNGAFEYNGTNLFFTRAGAAREGVLTQSAVTTEMIVADTSITVNIGGTTYKLLARA